ncbi:hypothetical protein E3N88_24344 [Mikania micrantha]|uniref:Chromo domain-containing protein n=1 Tax=Mikania micrantha TaxID=192012 RepID=A0A5N6N2V2_9ASTR|nr:hypothetical protein E3N88_24344 [Mikania micrantha]
MVQTRGNSGIEEYSYNTGFHSATRTTPFNVVYGRDPPALHPYVSGETKNADLEAQLIDRDDMLKLLKINLSKAQSRMRAQADSHRRDVSFQLPSTSRIHPVFHISLLKPAKGVVPPPQPAPLPLTRDWEYDVQPASVAAHRWVLEAGQPVLELLIHWQNRPTEEATWECYDLLKNQFLLSDLRTNKTRALPVDPNLPRWVCQNCHHSLSITGIDFNESSTYRSG